MAVEPRIQVALAPFVRRSAYVRLVRISAPGLVAGIVAAEVLWLFEIRSAPALAAPAAIALLIGAVLSVRRKASLMATARRIDSTANLRDLVVSALSCEGGGMAALVRDRAIATLGRVSPRETHPFELPRHWRRWAGAAVAAQVIVLPLIWRAPPARDPESGLSSLVLPQTAGPADDRSRQQTPTSSSPASDAAASTQTTAASRSIAATAAPGEVGSDPSIAVPAGGSDRLRLAAAAADADIAAGRVPLARRGIVQRYFATLQTPRKQDR